MRWSENETYQFVQLYLNQEYLWNTEHENYKVKEKRLQAYRDIVTEFYSSTGISLSVSELKAKIKNLRSTYTQELSKIKQRSNPDYKYTPTMKWFACWHKRFKRNSCTNQITDLLYEESEKDNTKMWNHDDPDSFNDQTHLQPFVPETSDDYILLLKNEPEEQLFQKTDTQPYQIKRKKLKHRSSSTASDGSIQGSLDSNVDLSKEDEFDIYGKFIASQLRTLDLKKALKLQLQIQGLVSEARLSDLSNG